MASTTVFLRVATALLCLLLPVAGSPTSTCVTDSSFVTSCLAPSLNSPQHLEALITKSGLVESSMGEYDACLKGTTTDYFLLNIGLGGASLAQGLCLHENCTVTQLNGFIEDLKSCNQSTLDANVFQHLVQPLENVCIKYLKAAAMCEGVSKAIVQDISNEAYVAGLKLRNSSLALEFTHGDHSPDSNADLAAGLFVIILLVLTSAVAEFAHQKRQARASSDETQSLIAPNIQGTGSEDKAAAPVQRLRGLPRVLHCFCPSVNFAALINRAPARSLNCLDGMRTLSMFWIITAHVVNLMVLVGGTDISALITIPAGAAMQFVGFGNFTVDTFFFLSGLLTSYVLLRKARKTGKTKVPILMMTVLRILRLTGLYGFVMLMYVTVVPYVASGPLWFRFNHEINLCRKHWWTNLIYINNFYPVQFHEQCMSWTWYLANDLQFFIVGLFLLVAYMRSRTIGVGATLLLVVTCMFLNFGLTYHYHLGIITDETENYINIKPYTRVISFAIGILVAFLIVDKYPAGANSGLDLSRGKAAAWMSFAIFVLLVFMFLPYDYFNPLVTDPNSGLSGYSGWSNVGISLYQMVSRGVVACMIGIITVLCVTKNGGFVNSFLALPIWEVTGKLTYGAYLCHPIIIRIYYYQKVQMFHVTGYEFGAIFLSVASFSYALAALLYVLVEMPSQNLLMFLKK